MPRQFASPVELRSDREREDRAQGMFVARPWQTEQVLMGLSWKRWSGAGESKSGFRSTTTKTRLSKPLRLVPSTKQGENEKANVQCREKGDARTTNDTPRIRGR